LHVTVHFAKYLEDWKLNTFRWPLGEINQSQFKMFILVIKYTLFEF